MISPEFGKRFSDILEKSGISNTKLTELAEISKNNIGNYKNGQIPNATTLYKLSQILGVSMEYMIAGKEAEDLTPKRSIMRLAQDEARELESSASGTGSTGTDS